MSKSYGITDNSLDMLNRSWMAADLSVDPVRVLETLINNLAGMIFRCWTD